MTTLAFDTLQFVHKLRDAGFDEKQAEGIADAFKGAVGEAELATLRDLEALEGRLNGRIETLETRLNGRFEALEYRLTIKLGTFIMLATGILIAAMKL